MKKIALLTVIALMVLGISGCGVQIKQEGNKIFTDADKDLVYKFTSSALEKEQYTIKERSREDGVILAAPAEGNEVFAEIKDDPKVHVTITPRAEQNDVMVAIQAMISGDVDEKKSTEVARRAVDRLIEELNKYGKFAATEEGTATVPSSDQSGFLTYLESALKAKNYSVTKTDTGVELQETAATSEYNDPLKAKADVTLQGTQLNVAMKATIEGNYDKDGNQQKARQAITDLTAVIDGYPVVEQTIQQSYSFVGPKTAFGWTKAALDTLGYIIEGSDDTALTLTTKKDNFNISVAVADAGDNKTVVNVTAKGEGGDKATLVASATSLLEAIKNELALYQVEKTDSKMFQNVPLDKAYGYGKSALLGTGYTVTKADKGRYLVAGTKAGKPVTAVCMVNSMGDQGIAIEVTAYVNGNKMPQAEAAETAAAEVAKILRYLAKYDKVISSK